MPQFSPSSRSEILAALEERGDDPAALGNGVVVLNDNPEEKTFTGLAENHGWYVASYDARTGPDRIVFMPFTGGDES